MGTRKFATWEDEATHRGRQVGLAEGLAGTRKALKIVIEQRFGSVPEALALRIDQVQAGDIDQWFTRAMQAESLASLTGGEAPR